ncbi:TPA: hypothetical protein I8Y21_004103 [Klebsiella oxytoca]|uniref:Uncharacterized protein n=1 Tax=Klebsiella oxytoca TaxID=571 RepID=A0AAN5LAR5_KLEOX|nr:hypothetical protein [Klebsiella oxytoca]
MLIAGMIQAEVVVGFFRGIERQTDNRALVMKWASLVEMDCRTVPDPLN